MEKEKLRLKTMQAMVAIIALTILESIALLKGLDGVLFSFVVAVISGLGGYNIKKIKDLYGKG
ncbi:hypothetical protein DRZ78_00015 [Candidatus Aerophobetes bacterium]|uniref:Uncharacterized protein n=1 Tax=Aerophobetes bacterium TaxID=2030807 RepID=A0A662D7A0_UNCAE|nr:MAG: hypothetical protein DRZ78_00015 [Candidatus Aerophobetes bacterium]